MFRMRRESTAIKIFYLYLLFWDTILGIGAILNLQWIQRSEIVTGNYCVAQGMTPVFIFYMHVESTTSWRHIVFLALVKQLAATGTAFSIMAMAFCILHDYVIDLSGPHRPWPRKAAVIGIGIISLVQIVDLALPNGILHGSHNYYGIAEYALFNLWLSLF